MPKKSRKSTIVFEKEAMGQFLMYLYEKQKVKPITDWSISKQEVRLEFRQFLDLPKNGNLRKRIPRTQITEVGNFLNRTDYLIDTPVGSDLFCINYQKVKEYTEIEAIRLSFEKKLILFDRKSKNLHRLSDKEFFKKTEHLPQYLPPLMLLELKKKKFEVEDLCKISPHFANYSNGGNIFTPENILGAMRLLLQIEDVDILEKYRRLIQRDVKLSQSRKMKYSLKLARKSRKIGCSNEALLSPFNKVLIIAECPVTKTLSKEFLMEFLFSGRNEINVPGKTIGPTYCGSIESIYNGLITFVTEMDLPMDAKASYMIIFLPARLTLRYQYRALELLENNKSIMERFIFPVINEMPNSPVLKLAFYNKQIAVNPEQNQAVFNIVSNSKANNLFAAPFIIFGPPGTGKTSIVVESILQVLLHCPNAKILVTTGPNCACDEIAMRICNALALGKQPRSDILARIYSWSQERRRENINQLLLEYSNMYDFHFFPDVKVLEKYRVVICTLGAVGKLTTGSLQQFTHIFLDEAAACSQTEALVGLVGALKETSKLIISGDHKQLGAILNSKRAEELGLGISLMERLLQRKCYNVNESDGNYNQRIQTRLCRNFRSHPAIVKLFSSMYYDDKLLPMARKEDTNWAAKWEFLRNPQFPILFHAVHGKEEVDPETGSISNWREFEVVFSYVTTLLEEGLGNGRKVEESDIGIITPYRSQYLVIQEELNASRLFQIETGSVETYRGKEKAIIIVSFVRSDFKGLGFLKNVKRLNVILSRAKALLILIGNDKKLCEHPDYENVIKQCQQHGHFVPAPQSTKKQ